MEWAHQRSQAGDQERHVLSFKKMFIHIHKQIAFQLFFFLTLSDFFHLLLEDSHDCFTSIMFCLSLIIAFTSIVLFQSPFFLTSFVFADSEVDSSICFPLKKLFSSHSEHCCYLSLFCFSDTFGFLVNGS